MAKQILVTHSDFDGAACAIVFKTWFPEGTYYSENYDTVDNRLKEILEYSLPDELYIADISPKDRGVIDLLTFANRTTPCKIYLFDHHKTAMHLDQYTWATRLNSSKCGAQLLINWLFVNREAQGGLTEHLEQLVWHANDYDLWKHENPKSTELNKLLWCLGFERFVNRFVAVPTTELKSSEKLMIAIEQEKQALYIREVIEHSTDWFSDSQDRPYALCFAEQYHSQLGHTILESPDLDDCEYVMMVDLKGRRVGLRSRQNGIDVSEIAKQFSGGGHQAAAGFQLCPLLIGQLNDFLFNSMK
jgi:uncharacterized protein